MEEFVIRMATAADASAVEKLLGASYPALMASSYDPAVLNPALRLITKANLMLLTSGTYYLAETPFGGVVGCGGWSLEGPPGGSDSTGIKGHLRHFATHPEWVGRGVGRAIYSRCEAAAFAEHVELLEVLSSLNAEGFYSALGFKKVREVSLALGSGQAFASVQMFRTI